MVDRTRTVRRCALASVIRRLYFHVSSQVDGRIRSRIFVTVLATKPLVLLVRDMIGAMLWLGDLSKQGSGVPGGNGEIGEGN